MKEESGETDTKSRQKAHSQQQEERQKNWETAKKQTHKLVVVEGWNTKGIKKYKLPVTKKISLRDKKYSTGNSQ